jgi:hypothetical protein
MRNKWPPVKRKPGGLQCSRQIRHPLPQRSRDLARAEPADVIVLPAAGVIQGKREGLTRNSAGKPAQIIQPRE